MACLWFIDFLLQEPARLSEKNAGNLLLSFASEYWKLIISVFRRRARVQACVSSSGGKRLFAVSMREVSTAMKKRTEGSP